MPYSSAHGYVHVAIPKTGTTSLVRAQHELHDRDGGVLELVNDDITPEFRERCGFDALGDPQPGRSKHLSAPQIRLVLGDVEYERCFTFTVVRNPWERMVSRYNFTHVKSDLGEVERARRGTTRSFHDLEFEPWLERAWKRHRNGKGPRSQLSKLADPEGRLLVDHVGRLSRLQETMDLLCSRIGVDPIEVSRVNPSRRSKAYADFYTDRTRSMVEEIHQTDIEFFGFSFAELEAEDRELGAPGC